MAEMWRRDQPFTTVCRITRLGGKLSISTRSYKSQVSPHLSLHIFKATSCTLPDYVSPSQTSFQMWPKEKKSNQRSIAASNGISSTSSHKKRGLRPIEATIGGASGPLRRRCITCRLHTYNPAYSSPTKSTKHPQRRITALVRNQEADPAAGLYIGLDKCERTHMSQKTDSTQMKP
jgi:hypothetical protein